MKNIIEFKNVTKKYQSGCNTLEILTNLNFNIKKGELVVIKGYIHSGKKTMFNLIGGLDRPTSGEIKIKNTNIQNYTDKQLKQYRTNNIGLIIQTENLIPNMTIQENFELLNDNIDVNIDPLTIITEIGLAGLEQEYPLRIIEQQPQQYRISKTLTKNPEIILCYEPTINTNTTTSNIIKTNLQHLIKNTKTTIIIVTENDNYNSIADKIITLKKGKIVEITENKYPKSITEMIC